MPISDHKITDKYSVYLGDCVSMMNDLPNGKVHFSVHSPPFADLYCYSDSERDMGNNRTYGDFFKHYDYAIKELARVMMPGRISAVHCMDIPAQIGKDGYIGLKDFSGDIIRSYEKHNFIFHSRHCIWKDPLLAAVRTKTLGLAHKQIVKDSSRVRTGIPDYVLAFMKKGENPIPIAHPKGLLEYYGERAIPKHLDRFIGHEEQRTNKRSHWIWQRFASPVWDDIRQTKVLPYRRGKDEDDTKHVCVLQLDTIARCIVLWSNPKEIVFTPFMGVGSEVYQAVKMGRKGFGVELKKSYYRQAIRNLRMLETKQNLSKGFEE